MNAINATLKQARAPAALAALALLATSGAVQAAPDDKVFAGASCQALNGAQEPSLNHNVDWISNKGNGSVYITCPLVRDTVYNNAPPRAHVQVYRANGQHRFECRFVSTRKSNGDANPNTPGFVSQQIKFAPVGWSTLSFALGANVQRASYSVRCNMPPDGRLARILLEEL